MSCYVDGFSLPRYEYMGGRSKSSAEVPTIFVTSTNENGGNAPIRVTTVVLNSNSYECTTSSKARVIASATTNNLLRIDMPVRVSCYFEDTNPLAICQAR